ncbi:MAG: Subtilase family protein [Verrucomicrobia bacterium]|nr:MAG: Subtilase family protein [Verrucomicrobiota bacterium]
MKTSPYKTIASLTLAFAACGGSAAAAPGDHLPRPEDPVVLPTEAETAELIKNRRESELRLLQRDKDGWDDIWVMIQKAHDKDYKFDPNDKTKDTDGDGVSDYEEMLVGRNATRKEPVYTREEWIAKIREERRLAIEREIALMEDAKLRWPERQAKLAETLQPAFQAGKDLADPDFIRHDSKAVRAKLIDRRNKAIADRAKTEAELDAIAAKYGVKRADERGTLVGESEQGPIFMSPQDAIAANSIFADDLWPAGLHTWQNTALSRNLTGAGIRASIWEANASDGTAGILTTHGEFNGARAVQADGGAASNHGTAVANVMVGGGIFDVFRGATNYGRLLRGIAYAGEVDGYNLTDFVLETTDTVLDGQNFSNHSYGVNGGWTTINVSGTTWWYWVLPMFTEDPRLGAYSSGFANGNSSAQLDAFVLTSETHLPVYAAGNPNGYGPGDPVPPATTINHRIPSGAGTAVSTVVRDWINGDDGYDTVLSPGTAKNVLTVGSITDINFATGAFNFSGFTGTGPTDDGRIKPELVSVGQRNSVLGLGSSLFAATKTGTATYYNGITADSEGTVNLAGTSFAAPSVAGGLMLAEQRRRQLFPAAGPLLAST